MKYREYRYGKSINLNEEVRLRFTRAGDSVKVAISAPKGMSIRRGEQPKAEERRKPL